MRSPEELSALFKAQGLKVTPQRQCIFRVLHGNDAHPTAESVFGAAVAEMPGMALKTVYQTLHDLAEMGEIADLDLGTGSIRFDPNTAAPHHHLVCRHCGKVRDLHVDFGSLSVPETDRQGFSVGSAEIVFRGVCEQCAHTPAAAPAMFPTVRNRPPKE